MKVHIVSPQTADAAKITKPITYQREGSDGTRLVAVPMGLTGVEDMLFPCRVAYKRGTSEVKNGRRRILLEDTVPVYLEYAIGSTGELTVPVEASRANVKIHSVIEIPWTAPIVPGTSRGNLARNRALATALKIHAMNLIPNLGTTVTGTVNTTTNDGTGAVVVTGAEDEYINSPVVRGTYGLEPFGQDVELGLEDTTVE